MVAIERIGHAVLRVWDVEKSVVFYCGVLGMELVQRDQEHNRAFLSFGVQHHDLGLFPAKGDTPQSDRGLGHLALRIEGGDEELAAWHQKLLESGVEIGNVTDHGMTHSVYFKDPDGNGLEIYCDVQGTAEDGKRFMQERGGTATKPLDLAPVA